MNWGVRIAVGFSIFCLITIGVTVYLMNQKVDIVTMCDVRSSTVFAMPRRAEGTF